MSKSNAGNPQIIKLLGESYRIFCPEGEEEALAQAFTKVESAVEELKKGNNALNRENAYLVAAMNLAHQLVKLENEKAAEEAAFKESRVSLEKKLNHLCMQAKNFSET